MTSRERVIRAIQFRNPDRVPIDMPEPWGSDFLVVGVDDDPQWKPRQEGEDEWGCIWVKDKENKTIGQVVFHPLRDYSILDRFAFPDFSRPERYRNAEKLIARNKDEKFVLAEIPLSFIHRLEYLRGHEEAWTDPYFYPQDLERLLDTLADIAIDSIRRFAALGVDGIISCDDWGLQDRPMVSPHVFRHFFKPRYQRVYHVAHEYGIRTFLHSCGHIVELLDDLIEAELEVIQMDQQENMGVDLLAKKFGGRICFWCPVDIQQTMVKGSVQEVRDYARKLIEKFGSFGGGFIARWYSAPEAVNHSWEKINAMAEAFVEFGRYDQTTETIHLKDGST